MSKIKSNLTPDQLDELNSLMSKLISISRKKDPSSFVGSFQQIESLDVPDEVKDNLIAVSFDTNSIACSNFTSHNMLNPSGNYPYANNPGKSSCSHPVQVSHFPQNTFIVCSFDSRQTLCPLYTPDYMILEKQIAQDNKKYYLTRYRAYDGSFYYKIYDNAGNTYYNLNYSNVSITDADLDTEARVVYNSFFDQIGIDTTSVYSSVVEKVIDIQKTNRSSYLLSLIS